MHIQYSRKEFIFVNDRTALTASVKQVLEYIEQQLTGLEYKHDIYFKTKSVVTELLTNAAKHAGTDTLNIYIDIDEDYLTIKKKECGMPFTLVKYNAMPGTKKRLTYDIMHSLYAINEPNNTIRFMVEESPDDNLDINEVAEHFGLLIVTKCAEEFIYHYDEGTKLNTFTVKVRMLAS